MSTAVSAFVDGAWPRHDKEAAQVFTSGAELIEQADQADLQPLGRLLFHVGAEHLGRFDEVLAVLERLRARPTCAPASPDARALWRFTAAAHLCAGEGPAAAAAEAHAARDSGLPAESDRGAIHALAAAALVGQRRVPEAARLFELALAAASYGPQRSDPLARALAVSSNNLAADLCERAARTPDEDRLMLTAAEASRTFWEIAGDWIHVERAEYRLAIACAALADGTRALEHARTALAMCAAHEADDTERFFANEALVRAALAAGDRAQAGDARTAAARHLEAISDAGSKAWCAGELAKLDALLA